LRLGARTDRGLVRRENQDSLCAGVRLVAVADGMGGMAAGDEASQIAIEAMVPLDDEALVGGVTPFAALRAAVAEANRRLREAVEADPTKRGMGTTLTALLLVDDELAMVHIGDSRGYRLRGGELVQLTKDDTYVQMLVDEGRISADEAGSHPQRSLVSRVLQGQPTDPAFVHLEVHVGDRYLLCSDGLSSVVSAETLGATLREHPEPDECAARLVDLALRAGGPDNVTALVADVVTVDPATGDSVANEETVVLDGGAAVYADPAWNSPTAEVPAVPDPAAAEPAAPEAVAAEPADEPVEEPADEPHAKRGVGGLLRGLLSRRG
jgi:protein phosphatase